MADQILSQQQIEDIFQSLTTSLTSLDPNSGIRISWQQDGAPGWPIKYDVAFIRAVRVPDPITRQRDTNYQVQDPTTIQMTAAYTRVHMISWIVYGPNSDTNIELIRDGLFLPAAKLTLAQNNLYMVLDVPPPQYVPELFNGQWWPRYDLQVRFNELVERYSTVPSIASVNITVETDDGIKEVID